ncbi:DNA-processing protein DprA [Legionella micdadei]|uniref:DNA processing protein n=1 Tax=Legionella micdadei TaxID=451 RepID=A0A098GB34_LEGMI|nr:DNA-processing protein DprA [Legionella micdadei]ARG96481.1 DNA processing protein DprA [Legionella micdadei]KTD27896.1 protein smf [Legionella micdadei]NSL18179.1 DNA-protecting protein DprA [Legionella micdadei]CEG59699.1 Protein smf [Legionella micdadei]SCY80168.1 DNA processing protein [Legionella micdadei]
MDNKYYLLALNRIQQIGPRTILKLLTYWPKLEEMFRLTSEQLQTAGLTPQLAESICQFDFSEVDVDLRWEEETNHHLLTWDDPNYPLLLKEIHDPPPVLYLQGNASSLHQASIAIVGSRKPSITGAETAKRFSFELALSQLTVISGLALGIDAQAHQGCIEANGLTIAILGTGIDCVYPRQHGQLAQKICEKGLLVSEFPLKVGPKAGHFPRRNRIISGLALATLVVEATIRSGSLITARLALEQNRDVLAIPGSIYNPQARGCHHLLQQGAKLVTSSQEVIEELGLDNLVIKQSNTTQSLARDNKNLVKCIGFEITTVDQIVRRSSLSVEEVACGLATLEIQGIIKAVPGGYMRCSYER